ncbi:hypothetical protein CHGG_05415 [Chaetomium globosum CBS 148.51]|uniref:O-methyltransferase n=1 Tax=Chaetomium globosum (strain ATCC 6205 / CBS 148.51 / DSM 1962 / NBRC 6347 / NRRL 1970) TaxID=306901 RepID=Q2H7F0_CHAGB|nr:uncharacterized protein CHGG_05415 [Chaetomium globosum CBS 148.51]EAQ88796.1 hypothetical protein CHGG_05415 [Chaetomium globosum CBS 148.51]
MPPTAATLAIPTTPRIHALLTRLHAASAAQENTLSQSWFYLKRTLAFYLFSTTWASSADDHMRDKFVALEEDKCHFVYLLARSSGARTIVEAGTRCDVWGEGGVRGRVVATEKEPTKAARAREHWAEAGEEVEGVIELREGDLLETLKREDMPEEVDFLLLDIWTPMALPTLKIVQPRLKKGAIVLADNTKMARALYGEYLDYIYDPANGFKTTEVPYSGGLQMSVYLPGDDS